MSVKKVVRTYYSKREGKYVTKTYTYTRKSSRGKVLVNNKGKVNKKNFDEFKAAMKNDPNYTTTDMLEFESYVKIQSTNKKKLTTSGFLGHLADNKIDRFFVNAGYSPEQFASETGVDLDELKDLSNWSGDKLTVNGRTFEFDFTYTGNFWREV